MANSPDWGVPPTTLTVPPFMDPNGAGIIVGQSAAEGDVYPELAALYAPGVVIGAIIQQEARFDYIYLAYVNPTVGRSFWAVGGIESVGLTLLEAYRVTPAGGPSAPLVTFSSLVNLSISAPTSDFRIGGVSQGRGVLTEVSSVVNSAAVVAEAVVLTTPVVTFRNGRAFLAQLICDSNSVAANDILSLQLRRNNVAGTILRRGPGFDVVNPGVAYSTPLLGIFRNATGFDVVDTVVATMTGILGNPVTMIGTATGPRTLAITDIGASSSFPNAPSL